MNSLRTCGATLAQQAQSHTQEVFYITNKEKVTYGEVDERSNRIANSLSGLGVNKGDKICVLLQNSLDHIYAWYASCKLGAVFVPINIQLQKDQMTHIINNSEASLLLVDAELLGQVEALESGIPGIRTVIISGDDQAASQAKWRCLPFSGLRKGSPQAPDTEVFNTDLAALLYTSGTTGDPKGVMLSHEYYIAGGELLAEVMQETSDDVFYATLPLYHIMGQIQGILTPLVTAGKVMLAEKFSVRRFWEEVRSSGVTIVCITGTQCTFLHQAPPQPDDADNPIRLVMAFPVPVDLADEFSQRFNLKMRSIYGLTEALLPLAARIDAPFKVGSLGTPTDYEVRIADDSDNELPDLEAGNILVRPKATSRRVFDGYYKMPEATVETLKHCWFHTGDVGYRDEEGLIWFASRKKDIIRFRGENISASQVEGMVNTNPAVVECAVIGVPSPLGEEDLKVVVRLKEGGKLKPEELMAFCEEKMTWFMVPRYVEYVNALPKTATDKVEKFKLKDNWKTEATWDREAAGYKLKRK